MRIREADGGGAACQPVEMRLWPERAATVNRHHLVNAITEQKTAIQRRNPRFGQQLLLTIEVAPGKRRSHEPRAVIRTTASRCRPPCATGRLRPPFSVPPAARAPPLRRPRARCTG